MDLRQLEIDAVDVTWKHIEHARRRASENNCESSVRFEHVRRGLNSRADALCNKALDGKRGPGAPGAKGQAAPKPSKPSKRSTTTLS